MCDSAFLFRKYLDILKSFVYLLSAMRTEIIKLNPDDPDITQIKKAAEVIDAGALVAFPTETVYGIACAAKADSLARLDNIKNRAADKYYTLHISDKKQSRSYLPNIGLRAEKLIKTAWPGPLTIVFELDELSIKKLRNSIKNEVFQCLYRNNSIGIRCPDNTVASLLLQQTTHPVVAPSANISSRPPAVNAEEVIEQLDGQIDLLLDTGLCRYQRSSTVVKISNNRLEILRPGVYTAQKLQEASKVKFLFVCTGNTCRSPMAEAMFSKYLAEKLDSKVDNLDKMGYKVLSAGTMGLVGVAASQEAVMACAAKGFDIKKHKSAALSQKLIEESDYIFVMSSSHRKQIVEVNPEAADKCFLLADKDVPDPIGQSQKVYDDCASVIEQAVKKKIGGLWK